MGLARSGAIRALVRAGARALFLNALAFTSLGIAAVGHTGWGAVIAVVVLLLCLRIAGRDLASALGSYTVARTLLTAALALFASTGQSAPIGWLVGGLFAATIIAEPVVGHVVRAWAPVGAHVPWAHPSRTPPVAPGALFLFNTCSLGVGLVLLAAGVEPLVVAVLPLVGLILAMTTAVASRLQVRRNLAFARDLRPGLEAYAPRFVLYWEAPAETSFQVEMWLPFLDRLGERYVVILRHPRNLAVVAARTAAPVLICREMEALDDVIVPSLRVAFYVNNSIRNCHFVRFGEITHIQLNHGDSDKAPSYNPVMRMYDKNFVAGQAAIDRFAEHGIGVRDDFFSIVGRPQVADVHVAARPTAQTSPVAAPASVTVLYAPTWAGFMADSNCSSLPVGPQVVDALLARGVSVIFRPHPHARHSAVLARACAQIVERLEADQVSTGRKHLFGEVAEHGWSIFECFNASDALISDVSSVVPDYLFSEKPIALIAMYVTPEEFATRNPIAAAAYVIDEGLARLPSVLDDVLGDDPMEDARRRAKSHYLGEFPNETYVEGFLAEAKRFLT